MTQESVDQPERIELIVTLKKRRGKNVTVLDSTAELTRRLEDFERAWEVRFEVLLQMVNELMRVKVAKQRPIGSRAKTPKIRRRRRPQKL
ncbi:MAG TPA: hypothetical protein VFY67_20285 [Pyrinomonadaceae bacterium]|nr:hypothetical protein [Pyrinomonadaceae bacterium]